MEYKQVKCPYCGAFYVLEFNRIEKVSQYEVVECIKCGQTYLVQIIYEPVFSIFKKEEAQ